MTVSGAALASEPSTDEGRPRPSTARRRSARPRRCRPRTARRSRPSGRRRARRLADDAQPTAPIAAVVTEPASDPVADSRPSRPPVNAPNSGRADCRISGLADAPTGPRGDPGTTPSSDQADQAADRRPSRPRATSHPPARPRRPRPDRPRAFGKPCCRRRPAVICLLTAGGGTVAAMNKTVTITVDGQTSARSARSSGDVAGALSSAGRASASTTPWPRPRAPRSGTVRRSPSTAAAQTHRRHRRQATAASGPPPARWTRRWPNSATPTLGLKLSADRSPVDPTPGLWRSPAPPSAASR